MYLAGEEHITFIQAARLFPGKRPSQSTLCRWALRGLHGIKLESFRVGGRRYTSTEAVLRFLEATQGNSSEQADRLLANEGC